MKGWADRCQGTRLLKTKLTEVCTFRLGLVVVRDILLMLIESTKWPRTPIPGNVVITVNY